MRLTLVALVAVLCLAYAYAADDAQADNKVIGLLDVADQGAGHANEGAREARGWGHGGYHGGGGGWGHGGWGGGGRGHGGWGGGGYGHGGYGGGGWGHRGHGWGR